MTSNLESYPERILPDSETVQRMREDLILQLGILTIARCQGELYDKTLDELRTLTEEQIDETNNL